MTNIIEINKLVPANFEAREKFFLNENNEIQVVIAAIESHYENISFDGMDGSTEIGRKAIKQLCAEINKKIKEIDEIGKSVTTILKEKPKRIDASRKMIRDRFTNLYNKIREPLLRHEAEQARIKAEQEEKEAEEQRKKDEELSRLRAEKEQRECEEKIAQEAAQKAKLETENKLRETELKLQQERDEAQRKENERLAEEQRKADEEARRNADVEHKRKINRAVIDTFKNYGIEEQTAIDVLTLIIRNEIPNVKITY